MKIFANLVGVCAVVLFVLSYQIKHKRGIVLCNVVSRALYVAQYVLLFAFEGAVLDVVGIIASLFAQNSDKGFIKRHFKFIAIVVNALIVICGILLYKNVFSLLPYGCAFTYGRFLAKK